MSGTCGTSRTISDAGSMQDRMIGGRFRIEGLLGAGRLSPVFAARSIPLGRAVALRVLAPGMASDPVVYEMFHTGVQAASRLNHPGLARVLDCGEEPDGSLFLATEYVAGRSLRKLVVEDGLPGPHRIAVILHHALSAIAAVHDAGLVHRALSPDNLLVVPSRTDEGAPTDLTKVCDLPLASLVELDDRCHVVPSAFARPDDARLRAAHYLSPEQERGEPVDARTNLYALGAVLYELLTGSPPFADIDPMARLVRRMTSGPPSPRARRPQADATLVRICMRALAPDPDARYASAREMRAELRALLAEDNSGRYVLRTVTSLAPPPIARVLAAASEPSGVTTMLLEGIYARFAVKKRSALRAELQASIAPAAALAVLVAFITAAFFAAHPRGVARSMAGSAAAPVGAGAVSAATSPPLAAPPVLAPIGPHAATDAGRANRDSRPRPSPLL